LGGAVGAAVGGLAVWTWHKYSRKTKSKSTDKSESDAESAIAAAVAKRSRAAKHTKHATASGSGALANAMDEYFSESVQHLIADRLEKCDPKLPTLLKLLTRMGANQCWHKHGTFQQHLFRTWRILFVWSQNTAICRLGLYHSAYSNSYVNLAIFKEGEERSLVRSLLGEDAEEMVYLFCRISRHKLIYDELLLKMPHAEQLVVPPAGLVMHHIKTGKPLHVTRQLIGQLAITTMADFAEQLFGWQDMLFDNDDGKLQYSGNKPGCLWPGDIAPGLWMHACSRLGRLARSCLAGVDSAAPRGVASHDSPCAIRLPPVFDHCTVILGAENERKARDLYWTVVTSKTEAAHHSSALTDLTACISLNPFIAEPHVQLAQIYLNRGLWAAAETHALTALAIFADWGDSWDKRVSWEGWIAWSRVLLDNARKQSWPSKSFGILGLGLVE